ncbi:MAG TPA: hydrogenase 3 maturation endopeptidase HyCI [Thermoprotei archaeon]|nr:MAG: hypothetical protein DRJ63_03035 [Thermoprotei archaeon]HDI74478.1 hydrogenase 3 maturation endopeptidase HyCI [Thermoprotei archaeon]
MELSEKLEELLSGDTVVVCTGNTLRGDDGVGVLIGRRLLELGYRVFVYEDGLENHLGEIGRLKPSRVLVIDAVEAGLEPGGVVLARAEDTSAVLVSTHKLPLRVISRILRELYGVEETWLLGVQVKSVEFGSEVSAEVLEAADVIVGLFAKFRREGVEKTLGKQ